MHLEFGLLHSTIQITRKKEPRLLVRLRRRDRGKCNFESLNDVKSVSSCLGTLSMTQVIVTVNGPLLMVTLFLLCFKLMYGKRKHVWKFRMAEECFLHLNFNCNLNLKWITKLTLSTMFVGLYLVVKYFSFTFSIHLG